MIIHKICMPIESLKIPPDAPLFQILNKKLVLFIILITFIINPRLWVSIFFVHITVKSFKIPYIRIPGMDTNLRFMSTDF